MSWVLENLIKNSIDAIRGKGKISIELSWDKTALISIQDSGSGIPKKLHRSVFEAGVTTKKRGWGLGLALAKRIVAQYHGGKLRLNLTPMKALFFLDFTENIRLLLLLMIKPMRLAFATLKKMQNP